MKQSNELYSVRCNLCGADDYINLPARNIRGDVHDEVRVVVCKRCGLMYLNPRWTDTQYWEFYKKEYRDSVGISSDLHDMWKLLRAMQLRGSRCLSFCRDFVGPSERVLEVGCSNGGILRAFQLAGYSNLVGVEPNISESQFAREMLGFQIDTGTLEDTDYEPASFDLILIVGSIDHFQDPLKYLQLLHRLGSPRSYLFVDSYNTLQCMRNGRFFPKVDHCYYFTSGTLYSLLAKAGWEVVKFERKSQFVHPLDFYNFSDRNSNVGMSFLARKETDLEIPETK